MNQKVWALSEISTLKAKTDRVRYIFMDEEIVPDGHRKHNILNAWLSHWEDPFITAKRLGLKDTKEVFELRAEAIKAVETYWFSEHGDGLPEVKRDSPIARQSLEEVCNQSLYPYLEDVCETFNKHTTLADITNTP